MLRSVTYMGRIRVEWEPPLAEPAAVSRLPNRTRDPSFPLVKARLHMREIPPVFKIII